MRKRRAFVIGVGLIASFSCVATYRVAPSTTVELKRSFPSDASLLVGVSRDGSFGAKQYPGSGEATTREVVRALSRCVLKVEILQEPRSLEDGVAAALARGFTHYVTPTILHWEDRATEWSGKRDKISIRIQVVETASGQTMDSTIIDGKSKWATFGGDHPEELLAKPLAQYAERLCP